MGPAGEAALRKLADLFIAKPLRPLLKRDLVKITQYHRLDEVREPLSLDASNALIGDFIAGSEPRLVSRFGSTELRVLYKWRFRALRSPSEKLYAAISAWESPIWSPWEHRNLRSQTGFFPVNKDTVTAFCERMVTDIQEVDLLGSWVPGETAFADETKNATITSKENIEPFFSAIPWTRELENKNVLVVHPFVDSISYQYANNRKKIFSNSGTLPDFNLQVMPAVQTLGSATAGFSSWFAALDHMISEALGRDFDVAVVGAGAYGLPLSAELKRQGKTVIHLGGPTQILFGIRGRRWEEWPKYSALMNDSWIKPMSAEKPAEASRVDHGVYW